MNPYESDRLLAEYLLFHYGTAEEICGNNGFQFPAGALEFPSECVRFFGPLQTGTRALDIGCAVGRASFELSAQCAEVIGIDFSQSFIAAATQLKGDALVGYEKVEEGGRTVVSQAKLPAGAVPQRVSFEHGDAMNLRADLGAFDYLLAANLLCRLPKPQRFLDRLPSLVRPGGLLVLTTPCSWMEEYTPRELWLADREHSTLDALRERLSPAFKLLRTADLPFVIREHARKFQLVNAQATLWQKR